MTAAEKAQRPYSYNISKPDADIAAEAAYFRGIIPDANGLLPCPMCGADGRVEVLVRRRKEIVWYLVQCMTCRLLTARKCTKPDAIAAWNRRGGVAYE